MRLMNGSLGLDSLRRLECIFPLSTVEILPSVELLKTFVIRMAGSIFLAKNVSIPSHREFSEKYVTVILDSEKIRRTGDVKCSE